MQSRSTSRIAVFSILAVFLLVTNAHAQNESAGAPARDESTENAEQKPWQVGVTEAQKQEAQVHLDRGNQLLLDKQWAKALEEYRQALKRWDHPYVHFNMAHCLVSLDRPLEAFESVTRALRYDQGPLSDEHYRQALTYKKLLEGQLSRIKVICDEPGAKVTLDGKDWFTGPGEQSQLVLAGAHQVVASKEQFTTLTEKITALPAKEAVVTLKLEPVKVVVKKPVIVWKRRWSTYIPWTVLGVGGLVALAGLPLMLKARSNFNEFDDYIAKNCDDGCDTSEIPQDLYDKESSGKTFDKAGIAMFAVGGATIAAGVVLAILNREKPIEVEGPSQPAPPKVTILPVLGPGGAAVSAGFSF